MAVMSEIINTRILEDSVSESLHKKHILGKYVVGQQSILASRVRLDSLRLNYTFGDDKIDKNEALKAFMVRNLERRKYRRTPMRHELGTLTLMVDEMQKRRVMRESLERVAGECKEVGFAESVSPSFKTVEAISGRMLRNTVITKVREQNGDPIGKAPGLLTKL